MHDETMIPKSEIKVRLVVSGFQDEPDAISTLLGCQPSTTWSAGDRVHPQARNVHHENGWVLNSPADPSNTTLVNAIVALLDKLLNPEAFDRLPQGTDVELSCVIYIRSELWPPLELPAAVIARIATIGGSVDFDIYPLGKEPEADAC